MIKELIEKLGISRRALAIFLESDQGNLSRYEKHTRNMPFAAIPQIAKLVALIHKAPTLKPPYCTEVEKSESLKRADWCRLMIQPL